MGCFNGTCGLTNLPILHRDKVALVILIRDGDYQRYGPRDDLYKPYSLPIYGKYDDYGGIEDVDPKCDVVFDHFLHEINEGNIVCKNVPTNFDDLITGIHRSEIYATLLHDDCYYLDIAIFHEEAFKRLIANVGARKPYSKSYTIKQDYEAKFDEYVQKRLVCRVLEGIEFLMYESKLEYENVFKDYGLMHGLDTLINTYIDTKNPYIREQGINLLIMSTVLNLARKKWMPQDLGSQACELMLPKILADYTLEKIALSQAEADYDIDLEETLYSFNSPLDENRNPSRSKFLPLYLQGKIELDKIHDYIEEWHKSDSKQTLPAYLGMSEERYGKWLETGEI